MRKKLIYIPRVQVSQYTSMTDPTLLTEIRNIIAAVNARITEYKAVQTNFEALSTQYNKFDVALAAAATKATDAVNVKNNERTLLLARNNEFGLALAANCNGDPTYITNTTMKLAVVPTKNILPKELLIPQIKKVEAYGKGALFVQMESLKPPAVIVMMMYKTESMPEWKIGGYFNKTRIVIKDLPRQIDVSYRFVAIDGFGNMSGFTETFTVSMP
jgi:hypothetical protein